MMTTKVDKAYAHLKSGMAYGDIQELLDLPRTHVYAINYALRIGLPAWKVSQVLPKITVDMKAVEIEKIVDGVK